MLFDDGPIQVHPPSPEEKEKIREKIREELRRQRIKPTREERLIVEHFRSLGLIKRQSLADPGTSAYFDDHLVSTLIH